MSRKEIKVGDMVRMAGHLNGPTYKVTNIRTLYYLDDITVSYPRDDIQLVDCKEEIAKLKRQKDAIQRQIDELSAGNKKAEPEKSLLDPLPEMKFAKRKPRKLDRNRSSVPIALIEDSIISGSFQGTAMAIHTSVCHDFNQSIPYSTTNTALRNLVKKRKLSRQWGRFGVNRKGGFSWCFKYEKAGVK